jgi:hypothetical protein
MSENETEARERGRPSKFDPAFIEQGRKLAELGATDREVAEFFDISESTLYLWKHQHKGFSEALKVGKETADNRVEQSLYRRAVGYKHDAVHIAQFQGQPVIVPYVEHHAPDTTACIFWLKNRKPKEWRDKIDHEHGGVDGEPFVIKVVRGSDA